jgi:hypothetical protein
MWSHKIFRLLTLSIFLHVFSIRAAAQYVSNTHASYYREHHISSAIAGEPMKSGNINAFATYFDVRGRIIGIKYTFSHYYRQETYESKFDSLGRVMFFCEVHQWLGDPTNSSKKFPGEPDTIVLFVVNYYSNNLVSSYYYKEKRQLVEFKNDTTYHFDLLGEMRFISQMDVSSIDTVGNLFVITEYEYTPFSRFEPVDSRHKLVLQDKCVSECRNDWSQLNLLVMIPLDSVYEGISGSELNRVRWSAPISTGSYPHSWPKETHLFNDLVIPYSRYLYDDAAIFLKIKASSLPADEELFKGCMESPNIKFTYY